MKINGQVFVYESEWTKDDSKLTNFKKMKQIPLFILEENHSSNPVDVIHYFHSAQITDNDKVGFELIYARPLRSYVEVNRKQRNLSMSR